MASGNEVSDTSRSRSGSVGTNELVTLGLIRHDAGQALVETKSWADILEPPLTVARSRQVS